MEIEFPREYSARRLNYENMKKIVERNGAFDDPKKIPSYFAVMCLVLVIIIFATAFSSAQTDLSGTWTTKNPAPYLVEYSDSHPDGDKVPHTDNNFRTHCQHGMASTATN